VRLVTGGDIDRFRRVLALNARLLNNLVVAIGVILILASFSWPTSSSSAVVLISVGTSLIASAVVGFLVNAYSAEQLSRDESMSAWQLAAIFATRAEMNGSSNVRLQGCRRQLDIAAFGLKGFRESQSAVVRDKVRAGVRVRILCLDPDSPFVAAREHAEREAPQQIRKTIADLEAWAQHLRALAPNPDDVRLRFYDSLPLDFYFRVDDAVYVGPYLHGYSSQQTLSLEFTAPGAGFTYWTDYFDSLWDDTNFVVRDATS
jgi:hypothetical protein